MATKHVAEAYESRPNVETMEFEISQAWLVDAGDGTVRIRINDVPVVKVDYPAIQKIVEEAGLDETDAMYMTEALATKLHGFMMGKFFTKRAKRVG